MLAPTPPVSVEQFEAFIYRPENADRRFELIGGAIAEALSSNRSSRLAARFIRYLDAFVDEHNLGHVTAPDGGYIVAGERYIPDVAFISLARQPHLTDDAYYPAAPDLAVEIVSPTDSERQITIKVANYLAADTTVWVVYPKDGEVYVYVPGAKVRILTKFDALDGGDALPGFSLPLSEIFR